LPSTPAAEPVGAAGSPQGVAPRQGPELFSTGAEAAASSSGGSNACQGFVGHGSVGPQQQAASRQRSRHWQYAPWSSSTSEAADIAAALALSPEAIIPSATSAASHGSGRKKRRM